MSALETLLKISLATPAVWRLTRMVAAAYDAAGQQGFGGASGLAKLRPEDVLGSRVLDGLYWMGMLMSAQTALWVVCGFAVVLLNWFAFSCLARLGSRTKILPITARRPSYLPAAQLSEEVMGATRTCR